MHTARHSRNQKNIHHRATEAQGSQGIGVLVASVRENRRGARIAATELKRAELLQNLCSARRFRTLVVRINRAPSIRVNPCPSVASYALPRSVARLRTADAVESALSRQPDSLTAAARKNAVCRYRAATVGEWSQTRKWLAIFHGPLKIAGRHQKLRDSPRRAGSAS